MVQASLLLSVACLLTFSLPRRMRDFEGFEMMLFRCSSASLPFSPCPWCPAVHRGRNAGARPCCSFLRAPRS